MKVLLTGATTPLGQALAEHLLAEGIEVVAVGRPGEPAPFAREGFRYVATDLLRSRNLRNLLWGEAKEADTLVHAAIHRSAQRTGSRAHALNVETTRLLLSLADEHPALRRLVYLSSGAVYRIDGSQSAIIDEDHPLNLSRAAPQWIRDRIEADLTVCTRMGLSPMRILVLRFAECLGPSMGSQLFDYLEAPVCFRPLGFDPVMNLISLGDMVRAVGAALAHDAQGIFNVPGADTLTLSEVIRLWNHRSIPVPGVLLGPLYRLRRRVEKSEFRYDLNQWRFHFNGVLSGRRARRELGYEPAVPIDWPALR